MGTSWGYANSTKSDEASIAKASNIGNASRKRQGVAR
jgi:hypothetical protein